MSPTNVLVVDDAHANRALRKALITRGFEVEGAGSDDAVLNTLRCQTPDVIILDLKTPGIGGLKTCRIIREQCEAPIMIVSALQEERQKVRAFESGADYYVIKPLGIDELVARIHAITRRTLFYNRIVRLGSLVIDLATHEVKQGNSVTHLTSKEFKLLQCLIQNAGGVVSHRRLLQAAWGADYGNEVEYLRVFINQLHKKIEPEPSHPKYLLTEPTFGYRFASSLGS